MYFVFNFPPITLTSVGYVDKLQIPTGGFELQVNQKQSIKFAFYGAFYDHRKLNFRSFHILFGGRGIDGKGNQLRWNENSDFSFF